MRAEIEQAIELLKTDAPDSLDRALELLQETVFSFSMRVCQQREDAEDTMQEVLTKSLPVLARFESPKALVVWLYKVAKTRCLMSRRQSKFAPKQKLSLEELMPDRAELARLAHDGSLNPEAYAIHSQQARRLRDAVQKLPPQYRMVLVLRDMEGLADDEVAEITGLKPDTVRVRLHRARLFVRKELMRSLPGEGKAPAQIESAETPRPGRCKAMFAELSNYLDEKLDDSLCHELERHMDGCEPCKAFLASLQAAIDQCRKSAPECPDAKKASSLRRELAGKLEALSSVRR